MKIFDIVQLNFKQLIRDKKNLFFLLLFPAVFMLIFGIGFGDNVESDIDIAIVNHDDGDVSNQLVSIIEDFNSSEDEKLFTVHKIDDETKAQEMLKNGSVSTSFQGSISIDGRTTRGTVGNTPTATVKTETNNGNITVTQ